ncbi:hypothetical protein [Actinopolymorpha pittospori]|uniref:Uncharacterized protein n=1 Tax=Actinopolymorpha pittospori TaxID=648752 RepID=A0A927RBG9_9ACTN|nr:hypothetical protein [Actinopolymorpha pittospori]MBE1606060.1 hypothetical protein [Actinopolymorpha pittospori]
MRSATADGLTWRIDPRADRADELAPGKVMFLTGRAVGRVLDVRREGADLAVTIGPVDITEVIRDGRFATDRPVAFDKVVVYSAEDPFWAQTESEPDPDASGGGGSGGSGGGGGSGSGGRIPGFSAPIGQTTGLAGPREGPVTREGRPPLPPPRLGGPIDAVAGAFRLTPTCCAGGIGAHFHYDREGVRLDGNVELLLTKPSGGFDLVIEGGRITTAKFQIEGGVGLRLKVAGATKVGTQGNIHPYITVPVDFTVPLGQFLGVPFSATINQALEIRTAFSAKDGNIKAEGEYTFTGGLGFGYDKGRFGPPGPQGFTTKNSITNSITGPSVGVNGLLVTYQVRFHVGIGAFGFTTGLYVGLTAAVGLSVGSALGSPITVCKGTGVSLSTDFGVGYTLPAPVVNVINFFLRVFKAKPIERRGGIGSSATFFAKAEIVPDIPLCRA